jgi:uroporphyrin-III C-methyltransferase
MSSSVIHELKSACLRTNINGASRNVDAAGKVYLVGAGPGDPELFTLKGKRCLQAADVILYDELVNFELLQRAARNTELIYVGKKAGRHCVDQRQIESLMIQKARQGMTVVRLKGGDPFVFGRGGEEAEALNAAGVPFELVPGVSSAIAVPANIGIPVTHRLYSSSVAIVTGHEASENNGRVKWTELWRSVDTLIILMGLRHIREIMDRLLQAGCDRNRPVALIQSGTLPCEKSVFGTVETIADLADEHDFQAPTLIIVGEVVNLGRKLQNPSATGLDYQQEWEISC